MMAAACVYGGLPKLPQECRDIKSFNGGDRNATGFDNSNRISYSQHAASPDLKQVQLFNQRSAKLRRLNIHMRYHEFAESDERLELPAITVGDDILIGKWKNRRAVVKGFTQDKHNQPVLKTDKGDQKLFKPRLVKLSDPA